MARESILLAKIWGLPILLLFMVGLDNSLLDKLDDILQNKSKALVNSRRLTVSSVPFK
jgi:hypothetical protein